MTPLHGKAYPRFTRLRMSCLEIMKIMQGHWMLMQDTSHFASFDSSFSPGSSETVMAARYCWGWESWCLSFARGLPWTLLHPRGSLTIPVALTSGAASPVLQIRLPICLGTRAQSGCDTETQIVWSYVSAKTKFSLVGCFEGCCLKHQSNEQIKQISHFKMFSKVGAIS